MKIKRLNENQSKFVYYSIRERLAAIELCDYMGWNLSEMTDDDSYENYDIIYQASGSTVAEVKIRRIASTKYPEDLILEKIKYDGINKAAQLTSNIISQLKVKQRFIVFFTDCVAIWDVSKISENSFFTSHLRASSVSGYEETVDKIITHLSLKEAEIINYKLDYTKIDYNAKVVFKSKYPHNMSQILNVN